MADVHIVEIEVAGVEGRRIIEPVRLFPADGRVWKYASAFLYRGGVFLRPGNAHPPAVGAVHVIAAATPARIAAFVYGNLLNVQIGVVFLIYGTVVNAVEALIDRKIINGDADPLRLG